MIWSSTCLSWSFQRPNDCPTLNFECMFFLGQCSLLSLDSCFQFSMEAFIFLTLLVIWTDMGPQQPVQNLQHCSAEHQMLDDCKNRTTFIQRVCKVYEFQGVGFQHANIYTSLKWRFVEIFLPAWMSLGLSVGWTFCRIQNGYQVRKVSWVCSHMHRHWWSPKSWIRYGGRHLFWHYVTIRVCVTWHTITIDI